MPSKFTWERAIRDAAMPVARKGFALILGTWADGDGSKCFPSIATLVAVGYSKSSVHRYLRALEADGWIKVAHGGGRRPNGGYHHNAYTLTIPDLADTKMTPSVTGNGLTGGTEQVLPWHSTVSPEAHDHTNDHIPTRPLNQYGDAPISVSGGTTSPTTPLAELRERLRAEGYTEFDLDCIAEAAVRIDGLAWDSLEDRDVDAVLAHLNARRAQEAA